MSDQVACFTGIRGADHFHAVLRRAGDRLLPIRQMPLTRDRTIGHVEDRGLLFHMDFLNGAWHQANLSKRLFTTGTKPEQEAGNL